MFKLIEVDKKRLYRVAYVYVKNEDNTREIVQISVYKAFLNIKRLKNAIVFSAWVISISVNCDIDY